jgi:hypothetical protein
MSVVGLELNGTRARAVLGGVGDYPLALPLEPPAQDLPVAISLEKATPEVGSAALRLWRHRPHLICHGFLAALGDAGKTWSAGRHRLDARQALGHVWRRLEPMCRRARVVATTLPAYVPRPQANLVLEIGEQARVAVMGSVSAPLAAALAGYAEQAWITSVLIIDIDDHALTLALVKAVDGLAQVLDSRAYPHLGGRVWKDRLLNALADCCVLQTRRDPRDAPLAEQALYEQLDGLLEASSQGRHLHLGIQATSWYQNLLIQPDQTAGFCAQLTRRLLGEMDALLDGLPADELPGSIVLTQAAGRLPGLINVLRHVVEAWRQQSATALRTGTRLHDEGLGDEDLGDEDFGEDLLGEAGLEHPVTVLPADALARSAHAIGAWLLQGDLPRGHLDGVAPLPLPQPVDAGPARLHFQGQAYLLREPSFSLGSHVGCHLVISPQRHPGVAGRHCDIQHDHRAFVLHNRSQGGTLVNDNPVVGSVILHAGDWIRLGAQGPILRFLGQANGKLSPSA